MGSVHADAGAAPLFRSLFPRPEFDVDLASSYAYPAVPERPWLRANMVSSADGGAWGASGRTRELSSRADRAVMGVLRGLSDVVVAGAATARIEGYRPVRPREVWKGLRAGRPATPSIAVVTRTLDLHPDLLSEAPADARTIVFTTESAPEERRRAAAAMADVVVAGEDSVRPQQVLAALAERGLFRVLTEGGPHLLAEFTAEGLLDELCLTVSPHLLGPAASRIVAGDSPSHPRDLRLESLLESEGALFARYRVV
ncbi:riboflavin biosynthesis pyrimidine reductase [Nocardiopsis mwathae]|uniref:Riboflavin biosynthesis pyrimidine reductase n=1 Tax=Nocardiopsis mwathae TaxID=1472723 RepID=A0A7W9YFN6_9ACTN|nr:pyrimidine reductase family protein [Nocardiopsis mwathae]MBB6171308.1 riboflavin biosynthesis pyrimidine reductase [Nocardiopsis mwathae]